MKKNILLFATILVCVLGLCSCLTSGLDPLPAYEDADITNFKFEHRWSIKEGTSDKLQVKEMTVDLSIDKEKNVVSAKITVPPAGEGFLQNEREKVSLKSIVGYCSLSTAARIEPIGSAPRLGVPGDFSQSPMTYKVTAADGKTVKEWKLIITEFKK